MPTTKSELWLGAVSPFLRWLMLNLAWVLVGVFWKQHWSWVIAGMAITTLVLGMESAFRIIKAKEHSYETVIASLRSELNTKAEERQKEAAEKHRSSIKQKLKACLQREHGLGVNEADAVMYTRSAPDEIEYAMDELEREGLAHRGTQNKWHYGPDPLSRQ